MTGTLCDTQGGVSQSGQNGQVAGTMEWWTADARPPRGDQLNGPRDGTEPTPPHRGTQAPARAGTPERMMGLLYSNSTVSDN